MRDFRPATTGVHTIRKRDKAGNVTEYRYHRDSKTRIYSTPGTPAYYAECRRAQSKAPPVVRLGPTYVYFIQGVASRRIKIGKAGRPSARLKDLQCGSPDDLVLLGIIYDPSGGVLEVDLHVTFAKHHVRGEWFEPVPNLLQYISEHAHMPGQKRGLKAA